MAIVSSGQLTLTDLNDTKQLILYLNSNYKTQIYDPTGSSYSPNFTSTNLVVTPELYIAGGSGSNMLPSTSVKSVTWYEGSQTTTALAETATTGTTSAGYTYSIPTGAVGTTAKPLTIKSNLTSTQRYTCVVVYTDPDTAFDITIKADVEVVRVQNGAKGNTGSNAITAFLTNSAVNLPATNAGVVSVFTGSANDIYVYDGTTALTFLPSGTAGNGQFTVATSISPASGVTLPTPTAGTSPNRAVYGNITAMSSSADVVTVTFTISGKTSGGTAISATVVQTFSKTKQALDGTTPSSYWMTIDSPMISKSQTNVMTPSTITARGNMQTGTGAVNTSTSFKWLIGTSTDGTTFTDGSVTTATSATSPTITSSMKAVRVRMYLSSVTPSGTNFIDEQVVRVVADGSDGNDGSPAYFLNVNAPKGDTIRNSSGTLDIQADLYSGTSIATGTITYKWYIQDINATVASGGDVDGKDGWRLITSSNASTYGATNYNTKTITITEKGINGVTGWKCVAIRSSIVYSGVIVLRDFQDPISVNILGANIFKNGEGSVTLTAQLLQGGVVVPNTGYTFAWALYNTAGTQIKTYSDTDDTVVVPATDVDGTANIVCTVSK